jgi:DNA-binding HxlR family transcriptional regulator
MGQVMKNSDTLGSEFVPPVFVGKWTVQIVNLLKHRPYRHSELRRQLETASQRMLTRTLRNLEATGLIERRVAQTKPLVVEYSLTKLGRTFLVPMRSLCRWAKRHHRELSRCRADFDAS